MPVPPYVWLKDDGGALINGSSDVEEGHRKNLSHLLYGRHRADRF